MISVKSRMIFEDQVKLHEKEYVQTLWVFSIEDIPKTYEYDSALGLRVMEVNQIQGYDQLVRHLQEEFSDNNAGYYIDIFKVIVVEEYGGIVADLNYKFDRSLSRLERKLYDFIGLDFLENGLVVAKPHHPIFSNLLVTI